MAPMTFPEPTIRHCRGCNCQQWFYPEVCPIPEVILCWKCRGTEFSEDDQMVDMQPVATMPLLPAWSEPRSRRDSQNRHYGERVASNCVLNRQVVVGELNVYDGSPRFESRAMHTMIQRSGDWQETMERFSRMCLRLYTCNGRNNKRQRAFKAPAVIYAPALQSDYIWGDMTPITPDELEAFERANTVYQTPSEPVMKFFDAPPVRYMGSKWKLADWIIEMMPPHVTYVEPFAGGASVFFRKPASKIEVLNDLNGDVVNFFRVLREQPDALIRAIDLTPFSRQEYELSYKPCDDPLERARRFTVRSRQSFGADSSRKTSWRTQRDNKRGTSITEEWARLDGLWKGAARLKEALIECDDALKVIARFDTKKTLFYVDPPYPFKTRVSGTARYQYEMNDEDHRHLAKVLHQIDGMVMISGYDGELYRDLYGDWQVVSKTTTTNGNSEAVEFLWMNAPAIALTNLPLFRHLNSAIAAGVN